MNGNFVKVSKTNRCQICGKPDWCMVAKDGAAAICNRVPEGALKYLPNGGGYLHRLSDAVHAVTRAMVSRTIPVEEPTINAAALAREFYDKVDESALEKEASNLGVSTAALEFLGIGWAREHKAWSFPMCDGTGKTIGIRLRGKDGGKWAIRGSRSGLFIPSLLTGDGPLFLVEGPTDTAALIDLDLDVIGRPSCNGGGLYLQDFLRQSPRDVVIVEDADDKFGGNCPYCKVDMCMRCKPGQYSARMSLAPLLRGFARTIKIISPLKGKDSREWKKLGATKETLIWTAKQVPFWRAA